MISAAAFVWMDKEGQQDMIADMRSDEPLEVDHRGVAAALGFEIAE